MLRPRFGLSNPHLCYGLLINRDTCDIAVDDLQRQRDWLVVQWGYSMVECKQMGWYGVAGAKRMLVLFFYNPHYLELLEPSERDVH